VLPGKALFAMGAVVIAATFVALMIDSHGHTESYDGDRLERFGEQQVRIASETASVRDCEDAVGHAVEQATTFLTSRYGDDAPAQIRALTIHRCVSDSWPRPVISCLSVVTSEGEMQRCMGELAEYQRIALEAEMKAFTLRPPPPVKPDAGVDADPYAIDPVDPLAPIDDPTYAFDANRVNRADPFDTVSPACVEYGDLIAKLATCDKLPQASRDALKQGYDALKSGWSGARSMPRAARDAMEQGCRQAVDALKQAGSAACGW
jgi:hypothetical protein